MKAIINGMGCTVSGAKLVLEHLLYSAPENVELVVYAPFRINMGAVSGSITVKCLNHTIWGKWGRIVLEFFLNIKMKIQKYDRLINLSNYGIYIFKEHVLYIHSPHILNLSFSSLDLAVKRTMLNTYLKNNCRVIVQTDHMKELLNEYIRFKSISFNNCRVVKPIPHMPTFHNSGSELKKNFPFEYFYPASTFPHKRVGLAEDGIKSAWSVDDTIGLSITTSGEGADTRCVSRLGMLSYEGVVRQYSQCDALLFTSSMETLGLPLLEALYFGKPAVLPDLEYAREIYADAGVYFKDNCAESLTEAILHLKANYNDYVTLVEERSHVEFASRLSWREHWNIFLSDESER